MLAIHSAINCPKTHQQSDSYIIFTDSLSFVTCLMNNKNKGSLKLKIINTENNSKNKITIAWMPGYSYTEGNEKVDKLAKEIAKEIKYKSPFIQDFMRIIKRKLTQNG